MKKISLSMVALITSSLVASAALATPPTVSTAPVTLKSEADVKGVCYINWNDGMLLRRKGYVRALANDGVRSSDGRFFIYLTDLPENAVHMGKALCNDIERSEKQFYYYSNYRDSKGNLWADPNVNFVPVE